MNDIKKKNIVLSVVVMLLGLMIAGGTYAFFSIQANITNTNYIGISTCFLVDYDIDNGDGTENITGTLFPSLGPSEGLNGRAGLKVKDECEVSGIGELKIHINNGTSASLMQKATSHCEDKKTGDVLTEYANEASCSSANQKWRNYPTSYCEDKNTLEMLKDYTTSGSCTSNNGNWVTNGSPLKYAVYSSNNTNITPVNVGHITSSDIGNDVTIYDNIILTHEQKYFYIYIWLDGYLTDNSHADLSFDGYISASATQNDRLLPNAYEEVEWLGSTGTQYIDTGYVPNSKTRIYVKSSTSGVTGHTGLFGSRTSSATYPFLSFIENTYSSASYVIRIDAGGVNGSTGVNWTVDEPFTIDIDLPNKKVFVNNTQITRYNSMNYPTSNDIELSLFAVHQGTNHIYPIAGKIYTFKIWDNNELVRNFIPCYRKSDNVRGLYDTIGGKFYTNAGSGTFEIPN